MLISASSLLLLFSLFIAKHFIIDFVFQGPYQYNNKGIYGHLGGLFHAGLHIIASFIILLFFCSPLLALILSVVEGIIHYHIDWVKVNINSLEFRKIVVIRTGKKSSRILIFEKDQWLAYTSKYYWWVLGFDQLLHYMTYVGIFYFLLGGWNV